MLASIARSPASTIRAAETTCTCSAGLSRAAALPMLACYALEVLFNDVCDLWEWHACVVIDSKHLLDAFNAVLPDGIFETGPLPYRQRHIVLVAVVVIRVC